MNEYISISGDALLEGTGVEFDLFLRASTGEASNYVLYCREGEELSPERRDDLLNKHSNKNISEEEKKQLTELRISIIQEIFLLLNVLISLPSRILISSVHGALKSSLTSGEEVFENLRHHTEILLDLWERLKK